MADSENIDYKPANDAIESHSQISACIEILEFDEMLKNQEISRIQVFYERIGQEIYQNRKKNYTWGFKVIEPEFLNISDRIVLLAPFYKEENLADLNSIVFKLFTEFCNIILSVALTMHIPIRGAINISELYQGLLKSKKPVLLTGEDPLIMSELLKVFTIQEIFPNGFSEGMIPAVDIPFHFGEGLSSSLSKVSSINAVGIFMSHALKKETATDVTILSNMLVESTFNGAKYFACNWKEWVDAHCTGFAIQDILTYAEDQAGNSALPHAEKWKSFLNYSAKF